MTEERSVVIDTNATVKKSRLPVVLTVVVVLGLVAYTVVYFATRDGKSPYTPGPSAQAVVSGLTASGIDVALTDDELRCIDTTFDGADLTVLGAGYDPFADDLDQDMVQRTGVMFDDCLAAATRVTLIAGSMSTDGFASGEAATCAATAFDGLVMDNGGYVQLLGDNAPDLSSDLFAAFADCGIDIGAGG